MMLSGAVDPSPFRRVVLADKMPNGTKLYAPPGAQGPRQSGAERFRSLVFPGLPGHLNLDNFKSGRAQYASDLQPRIFISRLDSVQNRIGSRFFHRIVFVPS